MPRGPFWSDSIYEGGRVKELFSMTEKTGGHGRAERRRGMGRDFWTALYALMERDMAGRVAYRLSFLISGLSALLFFVALFYVAKLVDSKLLNGSDYFTFAVIGVVVYGTTAGVVYAPRAFLMREFGNGTLEIILSLRISLLTLLNASVVREIGQNVFKAVFVLSVLLSLGGHLRLERLAAVIPILLLALPASLGLGFFQAGLEMRLRKLGRVATILGGAGAVLTGVYFPVSLLPNFLERFAELLPATHAINAARALLAHGRWDTAALTVLGIQSLLYLPVGLFVLESGYRALLREGTYLTY
ncbi:MAG: ABC transporter permease [Candidatus Hydrogenedentota bacterium]|nr:MAG: ABC transporter permease [Candidatus Hydrogenedentota bacterium]